MPGPASVDNCSIRAVGLRFSALPSLARSMPMVVTVLLAFCVTTVIILSMTSPFERLMMLTGIAIFTPLWQAVKPSPPAWDGEVPFIR